MNEKPRKEKKSITLSVDLIEAIAAAAALENRTFSQEVEKQLRPLYQENRS